MFRLKKVTCILVVILLQLTLSVNAQVYPVQGNVVLNPPYSPYLADLTALGSQRFWLSLRLQDPTVSTYNCKLRLTIAGVGVTLKTKTTFLPPPITLEGGGIPQLFYGDDLAAYFNPTNLDFAGITRSQYERTQRLPEGIYRFTIEVLDYNRGTLVSNKIGTTAWIVLNQPPLLNLPQHDRKIPIIEPTNIPFTWTPRHTGSPNAAFTTNYIFKLIELAPNATSQSANAAFLSQPVLFETTLTQNQFVYGPAEPSLLAGRKYAWQVQATDTEGRDLFRNNGKSEVFVFQYGDALGVPRNVLQQGGNATTLSIAWALPSQGEMPTQYRIRYKPYTSPANNWFESVTTGRYYTIGGLNPSSNYIVQVRSERGNIFSEYSAPLQMSTTSLEDRPYTCGQAPVLTPPTTTEILPRLFPGDEIKMHDFSVMVMTVEGSNGNYNGTGLMRVSLFNNASVKVRFSGRVNIHYELAGEIVSIPRKNSAMGQLVDEMEKIGADRKKAQDSVANVTNPMPVPITITGIIDSVWVQDSVIIVQREDGTQEEIVRPQTPDGSMQEVVLTDSVGNSYTVNEAGEVIRATNQEVLNPSNLSDTITYQLLNLVLVQFEEQIDEWLRINGKGGEDDHNIILEILPRCFPRDEANLKEMRDEVIPYHRSHIRELQNKIRAKNGGSELLDKIKNEFSSNPNSELSQLTEEDRSSLENLTCEVLVEEIEMIDASSLIAINFDSCDDCNLWQTPNGQLFFGSREDYTLDQNDQLLFDKISIVYYILKGGIKYSWNSYLEAYYSEEGVKYLTVDSSWYDDIILGLAEVGKDFVDPETYVQAAETSFKLGFAAILGGTAAADLGVGLGPEEYRQLYAQMQEWEGGDWIKFFTKIAYGAVSSYAASGLIIAPNGTKWVRVGSWMSKSEYDSMLKSMKAQSRKGDMHHVLLKGREGFRKQAKNGWVYVEYDIPSNTFIGVGGEDGWGILYGETSTYGKFYISKGYLGIGMPEVRNINLLETK